MTTRRTTSPPRLGPQQLAFVRAWAEGLDVVLAWNRYLGLDGLADSRRARAELRRLLDQLRALARAHGRPDLAVLLSRDPDAVVDSPDRVPSLDSFRQSQPPDFYSEAELLALYHELHGRPDARSAARRRQRLRARLLAALQWLGGLVARTPQPGDGVAQWLAPGLAQRLAAVGVLRLGELVFWIGQHGHHWHRGVPRLGPAGAARVVAWLQQQQDSLGALPAWALAPRRALDIPALTPPPQAGIVPLERLALPAALDGRQGSNRAASDRCRLRQADGAVPDDRAAVLAWLARLDPGSHTWRAYRREAERLLLWAVVARGKALSSLTPDDCADYLQFLAAPSPLWTAPRNTQRWQTAWRPFEGPLSAASVRTARVILCNLGRWLLAQQLLASNPWDDAGAASRPRSGARLAAVLAPPTPLSGGETPPSQTGPGEARPAPLRALSAAQSAHLRRWLDALPPSPAQRRLRLLLLLATTAGLRLSELQAATLDNLSPAWPPPDPGAGDAVFSLAVPGTAARRVALPRLTVAALRDSLADRPRPAAAGGGTGGAPLIARLDGRGPLSAARSRAVLVHAFAACAQALLRHDAAAAHAIRQASAGWLRHTWAVDAACAGWPADRLQQALGHRSLHGAGRYLSAARARASSTSS